MHIPCHCVGDSKGAYKIVKRLAGVKTKPPNALYLEDGTLPNSEAERQSRWLRHSCQVLSGRVVDTDAELITGSMDIINDSSIDFSPDRVAKHLQSLPRGKGTGPDGLPVELLVLGGSVLACFLSQMCCYIRDCERWPVAWKGGRQIDLYKGKGEVKDCNSSRGLLLSDHLSKVPAILKQECDESYGW